MDLVFDKDVGIPMSDGIVLRANVFRPAQPGRYPVLLAQGVYGKDVPFAMGFGSQWQTLLETYPGLCRDGSTGQYIRWETVDPERWVPDGYVVMQVDSRGSGLSPGLLDPFSAHEIRDYYEVIEWAGTQPWSSGKVGLIGVSYLAITQWQVAALQPPHLAAIVPWEGGSDHYRDFTHHGGIPSDGFVGAWWPRQLLVNQHGNGKTRYRDEATGAPLTGTPISDALLDGNRVDYPDAVMRHPLADAWHAEHSPDLGKVAVPLLSAGNWGGPGVHLRGNLEGFTRAGSARKWLSMHIGTHFESFYLPEYRDLQKRFLDHTLKGIDNGWQHEPPVRLAIRKVDGTADTRLEHEWPLARTRWTRFHLHAGSAMLRQDAPVKAAVTFNAARQGLDFTTAPMEEPTEITGPVVLRLSIASTGTDADVFAVLRVFDPAGQEIRFIGAHEPTPLARGWLRVSHRKLDAALSRPYRPFHVHDGVQPMKPGAFHQVDVEIWPTCIVLPRGHRLVLTVQGHDFEYPGVTGRILHSPRPGSADESYTIASGGGHESYLLLPIIPGA